MHNKANVRTKIQNNPQQYVHVKLILIGKNIKLIDGKWNIHFY